MSKLFCLVAATSILALMGAASLPAQAQGYKGVIADHSSDDNAAPADNTFGGAIAPSPKAKAQKSHTQPEGYRGVMPGHVAPTPKPEQVEANDDEEQPGEDQQGKKQTAKNKHERKQSTTPQKRMTMKPGYKQPRQNKELTAEDLKQIAAMTGVEIRLDDLPGGLKTVMHMPPHVYPMVSQPAPRVDGMLPNEYIAKQQIDKTMQDVNDTNLSPDARKQAIENGIVQLANFEKGLQMRGSVPDVIFQTMGVPDIYVKENREGSSKAIARLQDAIAQLRQMDQ